MAEMRALPLVPLPPDLVSGAFTMVPVLWRVLARVPSDCGRCALVRGTEWASSSSLDSDGVRAAAGGGAPLSWGTIALDGFVSWCEEVRRSLVAESAELEDANRARRSGSSPPRFLGVMGKIRSDMVVVVAAATQRYQGMAAKGKAGVTVDEMPSRRGTLR